MNNNLKVNDIVKLERCGMGKVEKVYDDMIVINICGQSYYRYEEDLSQITKVNDLKEYKMYLQAMIKQLTESSKKKRKEAANYNKETFGEATKRKGKVSVINGHIMGLVENSLSSYHRELLEDAKKTKEIKEKLKKELEEIKNRIKITA